MMKAHGHQPPTILYIHLKFQPCIVNDRYVVPEISVDEKTLHIKIQSPK